MIALLRAELRAGASYALAALLLVATLGLDLGRHPVSHVTVDTLDDGNSDWALVISLIAFAIGHATVAADHRSGAIAFLDGLPVSRARVFLAKVLAASAPVALLSVGAALVKAAFWAAAADDWTVGLLAAAFAGQAPVAGVIVTGFALGLLLSWLDGIGWGLIITAAIVSLFLSFALPVVAELHPWDGLGHVRLGPHGPVDGWIRLWPLPFAALSVGVSGLVFVGAGERVLRAASALSTGLRVGLVGCGGALVLSCSGCMGLISGIAELPSLFAPSSVVHTAHFAVLVRDADRAAAEGLLGELEAIDRDVRGFLPGPELTLDLELAEQQQNHLGQFNGGKIRARLEGGRETLAHELTHAHAFALAGRNDSLNDHVRFFHEGLATWVAERVTGGSPAARQQVAAAIHRTGQAGFDALVEDKARSETSDMVQAYPLGAAFIDALVAEAGEDAPARVLRALAEEPDQPTAGLALWTRLAERASFDLEAVLARYDAALAAIPTDPPPRLTARVADRGRLEVAGAAAVTCRFRSEHGSDATLFEQVNAVDGICEIPSTYQSTQTVIVQLGFPVAEEPVFLPWTSLPSR